MAGKGIVGHLTTKAKAWIIGVSAGVIAATGAIVAVIVNNNNGTTDEKPNSSESSEVKNPLGITTRIEKEDDKDEFIIYYSVPINNEVKEIIVKYSTDHDKDGHTYILGEYYYPGKNALAKYAARTVMKKNYTNHVTEFTPENVSKYFGVQNFTKIANQDGSGDDIAFYTYEEDVTGNLRSSIWIIWYIEDGKVTLKGGYEYLNERKIYDLGSEPAPWFEDVMGFCKGRDKECQVRAKIDGDTIYYFFSDYSISHAHCHQYLTEHKEIYNHYWPIGTMNKDRIFEVETYGVVGETDC